MPRRKPSYVRCAQVGCQRLQGELWLRGQLNITKSTDKLCCLWCDQRKAFVYVIKAWMSALASSTWNTCACSAACAPSHMRWK